MAEIRFNYGDKFTQTSDSNTGIGSTIPAAKLDIAGGTSAGSLRVSGIASLSSYQGFVNTKLSSTEDLIVEAGQSGSVSGEVVIGTGQTISVSTGATTGQGGVHSLKVYETFMPPVGGTADRPTDVKPGMVYYNKDFKTIEFWDGNFWKQVDNTTRSGRCVIASGYKYPYYAGLYDVIQIPSRGNAVFFGNQFHTGLRDKASTGNHIRGLFASGITSGGSRSDEIEYVALASSGKATDFANLTQNNGHNEGMGGSSTRGIWFGGYGASPNPSTINVIEYVEIMTLGDALDFGDLTVGRAYAAGFSSGPRGFAAGSVGGDNDVIDMVTMAAKGNAIDFGSLTTIDRNRPAGLANNVRGFVANGNGTLKSIDMFDTSSGGNAVEYGELSDNKYSGAFGGATQTRGVFGGGSTSSSPNGTNSIDFISLQSSGNSQDFGDLATVSGSFLNCCSDSHGGLGGI